MVKGLKETIFKELKENMMTMIQKGSFLPAPPYIERNGNYKNAQNRKARAEKCNKQNEKILLKADLRQRKRESVYLKIYQINYSICKTKKKD